MQEATAAGMAAPNGEAERVKPTNAQRITASPENKNTLLKRVPKTVTGFPLLESVIECIGSSTPQHYGDCLFEPEFESGSADSG